MKNDDTFYPAFNDENLARDKKLKDDLDSETSAHDLKYDPETDSYEIEVASDDQDYEDFYVYQALLDGHPLANMKQGDAHKAAQDAEHSMRARNQRYSDAKTFLAARQREVEEQRARAATARLAARVKAPKVLDGNADVSRTLFDWEKPQDRFKSPWMKERELTRVAGAVHRGPQRK